MSKFSKIRYFLVILGIAAFVSAAAIGMEQETPIQEKSSETLIDEFLKQVENEPEEIQLVMNILNYRALMFETFIGEFLSVAANQDDSSWDKTFVSFMNAESLAYGQTKEPTKEFLRNLDQRLLEEGSELSFDHLMLLERARRELLESYKALCRQGSKIIHTISEWPEGVIYAPCGATMRKQLELVRSRVNAYLETQTNEAARKEAEDILTLCSENESAFNRINQILGIDTPNPAGKIPERYSGSSKLKQAYNVLYLRLFAKSTRMNMTPSLRFAEGLYLPDMLTVPFAVECIAAPPAFLADVVVDKNKIIAHLDNIEGLAGKQMRALSPMKNYLIKMCKNLEECKAPSAIFINTLLLDIVTLRAWFALTPIVDHEGVGVPDARLRELIKYHSRALKQSRSESEKAKQWIPDNLPGKRKSEKKKKAAKTRVVRPATAQEPDNTIQQPAATALKMSPKKRNVFVRDSELLRELFNYDRLLLDERGLCVFRQNNDDGRQVTVVLFEQNEGQQKPLTFDGCDVIQLKRKSDTFHTISPILCSHSHFGYWLDASMAADLAGVHRRFAHPIVFKSDSQRALVIPAKIIHTPFCTKDQALRHPGTEGAYVFIFDKNVCFHAMFHHFA